MGLNKIPPQLAARIAYLDETIPTLQNQLEALHQESATTIAYLPFAGPLTAAAETSSVKPKRPVTERQSRPYKDPDVESSVGQAVRRSPHGLTADELMVIRQREGRPFVRSSLVSQLRKLTQRPSRPLTKVGDRSGKNRSWIKVKRHAWRKRKLRPQRALQPDALVPLP